MKWYLRSQLSQVHLPPWSPAAQGQRLPKAEPTADQKPGWTSPHGAGPVASGWVSVGEGRHRTVHLKERSSHVGRRFLNEPSPCSQVGRRCAGRRRGTPVTAEPRSECL